MTSFKVFSRVGYHGNSLEYPYAEEQFVIHQTVCCASCDCGTNANTMISMGCFVQNIYYITESVSSRTLPLIFILGVPGSDTGVAVAILTCNQEVLGSNVVQDTGCPD
jgi:hypothetical protein